MARKPGLFITGIALLAALPAAQAQIYKVTLSGANEIPAAVTNGTGTAIITLNGTTHEMRVIASFSGLVGASTASHVHCCVVQPANAGVATTTPTFPGTPLGVTSGSWDRTYDMSQAGAWNPAFITPSGGTPAGAEAAFRIGVAAGQSYLNVHSTTFPGGEIRGFLVLNSFSANTALSAGANGAAVALDSLGAGTGALSNALVTLAALAPGPQAAALEMLKPAPSRGLQIAMNESLGTAFDQVSNRLDGLRLAGNDQAPVVPAALGELPSQAGGVWLVGHANESDQPLEDGFAGYKHRGSGGAIGLDRRLDSGWYVGASVDYSHASLTYRDQSAGDTAHIKSTQVMLYATHDFGPVFVDGIVAGGRQDYENTRNTGVSGVAVGAYDGSSWGARVGAGMPIALSPRASVTPQLRVDWNRIKQDSYGETGGGPLSLSVSSRSTDRLRASLGAQLDFAAGTGNLKVRPYLRAFWHHNISNNGLDATASFISGGTSFITPGQKPDKDPYSAGAGVNFYTNRAFSAALTYDGVFADSYRSHVYSAKARWSF